MRIDVRAYHNAKANQNPPNTEKIAELGLYELRKYACPRVFNRNDWYTRCEACKGLNGCPAGKRAVEILKEDEKLKGGAVVNVPEMKEAKPPVEEKAEGKQPVKDETAEEKKASGRRIGGLKGGQKMTERARKEIVELCEGRTGQEVLDRCLSSIKPESKVRIIYTRIHAWEKKYPDLYKKYEPVLTYVRSKFTKAKYYTMTLAEYLQNERSATMDHSEISQEEDEITLDTLLKEAEEKVNTQLAERKAVSVKDVHEALGLDIPGAPENAGWVKEEPCQNPVLNALDYKRQEVRIRCQKLLDELEAAQKELEALDLVVRMFQDSPVPGILQKAELLDIASMHPSSIVQAGIGN